MRIAIVRLSSLGDIVHSSVVLPLIKGAHPDSHITWVVDEHFQEILQDSPFLNEIHAIPLKEALKCPKTLFRIHNKLNSLPPFDLIIDMQGLMKSALIASFLKGKRVGFDYASAREGVSSFFYSKKVSIPYERHIFERNIYLAESALNITAPDEYPQNKPKLLGFKECREFEKRVVFIMGASKEAKKYPKELFLELSNLINTPIYISHKDSKEDAEFVAKNSKNDCIILEFGLNELKELVSKSALVIGPDSGPTHIAWAMNTPSITLFGNTPQARFCPNTPINKCLSAKEISHSKGFDQKDFSIKGILPQDIAMLASDLIG